MLLTLALMTIPMGLFLGRYELRKGLHFCCLPFAIALAVHVDADCGVCYVV